MPSFAAPDLTRHAPRSPRATLGGYALGARMIDKCRAGIAGTAGEYHYDCPLDRLLLRFTGVTTEAFRTMVATGADDGAAGRWLAEHSRVKNPLLIGGWTLWWRCWPPFLMMNLDDWWHERKARNGPRGSKMEDGRGREEKPRA